MKSELGKPSTGGEQTEILKGKRYPTRYRVSAQGSLLTVSTIQTARTPAQVKNKAKRSIVRGTSAKSRKRLLERTAILSNSKLLIFITVTYLTSPDVDTAKRHLHAFLQHIKRHAPRAAVIWKMEEQERGAIHFHFLAWNLPFWHKDDMQATWARITGQSLPFTRIEAIRRRKQALRYVSKYMAKAAVTSGLDYAPYLHERTGRTWGMHNRQCFEYAPKTVIQVNPIDHEGYTRAVEHAAYFELRARAAKIFPPIAFYPFVGFSVFVEHAESLLKDLTVTV